MRRLGYEIVRTGSPAPGSAYGPVQPLATYSPWLKDGAFQEIYRIIESHTLVDHYRCYELWTLVAQTQRLRGSLIEVGVWRGGTGVLIAKQASLCGVKDPVYLCDTFTGVVKAGGHDALYRGGEHADTSRGRVEALAKRLRLDNVRILEGVFPNETASLVEATEFRFCHIDVDVYQSAKEINEWVWDKLVVGGIVVYDDYGFSECDGITRYVDEQRSQGDRVSLHNLNGHAVIVKLN